MRYLIIIFVLLFFVQKNRLAAQNIDYSITKYLNSNHTTAGQNTMTFITNSVTPMLIAAPVAIFAYGELADDPNMTSHLTEYIGSVAAAGLTTLVLKNSIKRDRPFVTYPEIQKYSSGGSYSFPSGHTSAAFSTATTISLCYPKWYVIAPAMTWAGLVGYSRMYLGVHYPSDVLAGAIIGSGSAFLSHYINKKIREKKKPKLSLAGGY